MSSDSGLHLVSPLVITHKPLDIQSGGTSLSPALLCQPECMNTLFSVLVVPDVPSFFVNSAIHLNNICNRVSRIASRF